MSDVERYLILKLDEASAEDTDRPTTWVQVAAAEKPEDAYATPERILKEWLAGNPATAAGEYLVTHVGSYGNRQFTVTPRVEFDVEQAPGLFESGNGGLEVVA